MGYFSRHQRSWLPATRSAPETLFLLQQPGHVWNQHLVVKSRILYLVELILSQIISDRVNILPSPTSESPQRYTFLQAGCSLSAWFPWPPFACRCPECTNEPRLPARSWVPRNSGRACLPAHLFLISAVWRVLSAECGPEPGDSAN